MTYKEILRMVGVSASDYFCNGLRDDGMRKAVVECATKIYIAQMQLEKEKLQEEYEDLHKKCNETLYRCSKECNEPCQETTNLNDLTPEEKAEYLQELLDNKKFERDEDLY